MKEDKNTSHNLNFMTAYEASDYLKIPLSTLYDLSQKGRIRAVKIGRRWRYLREDVEKCLLFGTYRYNAALQNSEKMPVPINEKRMYPRINSFLLSKLILNIPEKKELQCLGRILNIGLGGVFIENSNNCNSFKEIKCDDPINVEFRLGVDINAGGRVLRIQNNGIAVKFRGLTQGEGERISEYVG